MISHLQQIGNALIPDFSENCVPAVFILVCAKLFDYVDLDVGIGNVDLSKLKSPFFAVDTKKKKWTWY
jgi:hypothetical protein